MQLSQLVQNLEGEYKNNIQSRHRGMRECKINESINTQAISFQDRNHQVTFEKLTENVPVFQQDLR